MSATPQEIFQRFVHAGTMSHDADAFAALFTEDGVLEAPLVPAGHAFPRRLEGREAIRSGMAAYYAGLAEGAARTPNFGKSGYVLHTTADPDVFVVEIDTVFDGDGDAADETASLVQVFRVRDGRITRLRDYFAPELLD